MQKYQFTQRQAQHLSPDEFYHYAHTGLIEGVPAFTGELERYQYPSERGPMRSPQHRLPLA